MLTPRGLPPLVAVLVLLGACGRAPAGEAPASGPAAGDATAVLRAFFAEEDAAKRADLAARFAAAAPKPWADLKAMLHAAAPRPALPAGRHQFLTAGGGAGALPQIRYTLRVPAGYAAGVSRGWPLVIVCHGSGGSSEGAMASIVGWLGGNVEDFLVAAADAPDAGNFEPKRINMEYALAVLDDARRRANVDSDRTILTGYSKGGYATWATALFAPGEWAGAVPMASYPMTEAGAAGAVLYLPNVLRLDVQHHWGANDIEAGQKEGINTLSRDVALHLGRHIA